MPPKKSKDAMRAAGREKLEAFKRKKAAAKAGGGSNVSSSDDVALE